ncbi:B2 bradykinin receptor-like [Sphaeramia orbicularis]|uniref:B2 bradykinin receptor-like n=1 Tax=Sphaeramia orbicularis TaxID=375764 RepID=A0A673CAP2_9TELE|nr:B2 bradykinin receptor-like [Sphaeramia orbicularis]
MVMTMDLPTSFSFPFSNTTIYEDLLENSTPCPETETQQMFSKVVPVYIFTLSVLGIVLNILVLLVFWLHKNPCTVPEIYLSNLAAADLLLMCFMPFWAVTIVNKYNWVFGPHMCRLVNLCIVMNANCSIYFLVLVSIDRFLALVHPLSHARMRSRKCAKFGCLLVWCFGLILSIPTLVCRKVKHKKSNITQCILGCSTTMFYTNEGILTVVCFIIPVMIISYCTVRIIRSLNKRPIESLGTQRKEYKSTILVLVVLVAFLICWVPFHLTRIIDVFLRAEIIPGHDSCDIVNTFEMFMQIFSYIAFLTASSTPILYVIVGKTFRDKTLEVFCEFTMKRVSTSGTTASRTLQSTGKKL